MSHSKTTSNAAKPDRTDPKQRQRNRRQRSGTGAEARTAEPPRRKSPPARSIIGGGNSRKPGDRYATPLYAIEALLRREQFPGVTWEPAQGDGRIVRLMQKYGCDVSGSDILDGVDFLGTSKSVNNVVTNPPWKLKTEFISQAKKCASGKIALLLPIQTLGGVYRQRHIFSDTTFRLKRVYVFPRFMQFDPGRSGGSTLLAAWFVWDRSHKRAPMIRWFDADSEDR